MVPYGTRLYGHCRYQPQDNVLSPLPPPPSAPGRQIMHSSGIPHLLEALPYTSGLGRAEGRASSVQGLAESDAAAAKSGISECAPPFFAPSKVHLARRTSAQHACQGSTAVHLEP
ncbi:hypothetical protein PLESTB_000881600 [Pleodorina starrii]|uniref:Uncharacterized protein n=1 Tax=Pleodorina starrii TaxID=330485 RepID=A0A9W6BM29_9CHLO|nr:hypothetical protein PLESTB_000881600 [Pleodorina starrii]